MRGMRGGGKVDGQNLGQREEKKVCVSMYGHSLESSGLRLGKKEIASQPARHLCPLQFQRQRQRQFLHTSNGQACHLPYSRTIYARYSSTVPRTMYIVQQPKKVHNKETHSPFLSFLAPYLYGPVQLFFPSPPFPLLHQLKLNPLSNPTTT